MEIWAKEGLCKKVRHAGFCSDGQHAVVIDEAGSHFLDLQNGNRVPAGGCKFNAVSAYEPFRWQGADYLIHFNGNGLELYSLTAGYVVAKLNGHTGFVACAHARPDSDRLVSGSFDKTVRVWNLATRQEVNRFSLSAGVTCAALSANAQLVLAVCKDDRVSLLT
jgi:WD40 repeat protein